MAMPCMQVDNVGRMEYWWRLWKRVKQRVWDRRCLLTVANSHSLSLGHSLNKHFSSLLKISTKMPYLRIGVDQILTKNSHMYWFFTVFRGSTSLLQTLIVIYCIEAKACFQLSQKGSKLMKWQKSSENNPPKSSSPLQNIVKPFLVRISYIKMKRGFVIE